MKQKDDGQKSGKSKGAGNMGIYVNPGNTAFRRALNSEIYVDKTDLISITNNKTDTVNCYMCVSRPRRFGKSMAADMLVAYYSKGCDSRSLFDGKKIEASESFAEHLNRHHVIRLDVQQFLFHQSHLDIFIHKMQEAVIKELRMEFGECFEADEYGLPGVLKQLLASKDAHFIFIIDEWDCVFRLAKERKEIQKNYLDFLRGLFKGNEYVELAYMTGILPIKKYGEHSAINIFKEYSMLKPGKLTEYFGFTEEEVRELCDRYEVDFHQTKRWYDGYLLNKRHIYNPQAVAELMDSRDFQSYWTGTETYEALKVYIDMNFDGLKEAVIQMLGNGRCRINPQRFQNDMTTFSTRDDVLTLLVHLGYLTYDNDTSEVLIPNQEIAQEFLNATDDSSWNGLAQALNLSEKLLRDTWALNGTAVAEGLEKIHNETTAMLQYNHENALTCTILIAYYSAKSCYMNPVLELPSGKGFADVVYLPKRNVDRPALVIELKRNHSAEGAIRQIREKQYASWLEEYTGKILLVGINYDEKKGHECVIEEYVKN